MKIGLIENQSAKLASTALASSGHICVWFTDEDAARHFLKRETVDLLILDQEILGRDNLTLLTWSKDRSPEVPVVMLTDPCEPERIVAALEAGADEYFLKPVVPELFAARIAALDRLLGGSQASRSFEAYGRFSFDLAKSLLLVDGHPVELTAKEFALALTLFRNSGRTLSRSYLYEAVWKINPELATRTLDVHISKLRTKALLDGKHGCRLRPIYARGYRLELDHGYAPRPPGRGGDMIGRSHPTGN